MLPLMGEAEQSAIADSETALVERARQGDRASFESLMQTHLTRVWKVVWRIVRHHEDCEDVVQEVFLSAWQALPGYRGEAKFSTWIHTIAVSRALNHLDRSSEKVRRAADSIMTAEESEATGAAWIAEPAATGSPTPLQSLEAEDLMQRLARCLDRLPGAWRAVLTLRDTEELSYDQIASALSLALGTVRSRLARARLALRDCVEGSS